MRLLRALNGIVLFVILSLITVVVGKVLWNPTDRPSFLLWYGITVTAAILTVFFLRYLKYTDPYQEAISHTSTLKTKPLVSCMVAAYNEEAFIKRCIDSMMNQTYENKEIIIVNDASTDGTIKVLELYQNIPGIRILDLKENVGKKRALAEAMLVARGTLFAFTDSDSVWESTAIERIVHILEYDKDIGGVSGHTRALNWDDNLLTKVQDSWYEGQFAVRKAFESAFCAVTCVSGPLAVFRREAIFNFIPAWIHDTFLGGEFKFATDRTLTSFLLGSKVLGEKIKRKYHNSPFVTREDHPLKDWKVVYSDAARAWTIVPNTWKRFIKQQIRWKKSFIRNVFFLAPIFWRKPFWVMLVYYLHVLFVLVGPFIVFRHVIYLPTQGNIFGAVLYFSGILFIGFLFALDYKRRNRDDERWIYRPLMGLLSTLVLSWLIYYSALTIRDKTWSRG